MKSVKIIIMLFQYWHYKNKKLPIYFEKMKKSLIKLVMFQLQEVVSGSLNDEII